MITSEGESSTLDSNPDPIFAKTQGRVFEDSPEISQPKARIRILR